MPRNPTRKIKGTNLYLDPQIVAAAKAHAAGKDMSLSTFVERLMRRAVARTYTAKTA